MPKPKLHPATPDALGAQAKVALAQVEALTIELEAKTRMTREAWLAFGQTLLEARRLMPDKQKFGRWVRQHGLNVGLAKRTEVRARAMWMAQRWPDLQSCTWLRGTHPTEVQREWLAHQEAEATLERRLGFGGLDDTFHDAVQGLNRAVELLQFPVHLILRKHRVTAENVSKLAEYGTAVAAALSRVLAYASEHPEMLSEKPIRDDGLNDDFL